MKKIIRNLYRNYVYFEFIEAFLYLSTKIRNSNEILLSDSSVHIFWVSPTFFHTMN